MEEIRVNDTGWRLSPLTKLVELPFGGYVLVELQSLTCHELLDPAGRLLRDLDRPAATEEEQEFRREAHAAGWITTGDDEATNR
jgi:hypothetical protein